MIYAEMVLKQPHTTIVMALLFAILGIVSFESTPTDVFPSIDISAFPTILSLLRKNHPNRIELVRGTP